MVPLACIGVAVLVLGSIAAAIMRPAPQTSASPDAVPQSSLASFSPIPAPDQVRAKAFDVSTLEGARITESYFEDHVTVVNVWASWCAPCRDEASALKKVSDRSTGQGIRFLGVNVNDTDSAAREFHDRYEIDYPSTRPEEASVLTDAFDYEISTTALPTTLIVDSGGYVVSRFFGAVSEGALEAELSRHR